MWARRKNASKNTTGLVHCTHPTSRIRRCNSWVNATANGHARPCPIMKAYAQVACIATIPCIALLPFGTDIRSVRMSGECDDVCSRFPPHASEWTCRACRVAFARATCAAWVFLQLPHDRAFVGRGQAQGLPLQRAAGQVGTSMTWVTASQPNRGRNIRQCGLRAP